MNKRKWIITVSGILILFIAILTVSLLPDADPTRKVNNGNGQTAVNTFLIQSDTVVSSFPISGRVIPAESVELFAEVGGKASFSSKAFKSGTIFQAGEIMLQIDDREFRNAVLAQKSQFKSSLAQVLADIKLDYPEHYTAWENYLLNLKIKSPLAELPQSDDQKFDLFLSGRNILSQFYKIKEAEERLSKYQIRAPFRGGLTEAYVDRGSLIRVGQALGEFISSADFELEASVEQGVIPYLKIGDTLSFRNLDQAQRFSASLVRINEKIDPANQLVKVYFELIDERLKAGMYLEGDYRSATYANAVRIPATALVENTHAFIVEDNKAKLVPVEVLQANTNQAVVRGLSSGDKLIVDKHNRAFAGSEIIELAKKEADE